MASVQLVSPAQITIDTAGTQERVVSANVDKVIVIFFHVPAGNTGSIAIGDSDVDMNRGIVIAKGSTYEMKAPEGHYLDIYSIWADSANNGDKLNVSYFVLVG